jgi:hypothetical protein
MHMSNETKPKNEFFQTVAVPVARGLERFFWDLAWFAVFVVAVFGLLCAMLLNGQNHKGDRSDKQHVDSTKSEESPDLQSAFQSR